MFVDIKFRDGHCRICMHHIIDAKVTNLLIPHRRRKQKKGNREVIKEKANAHAKGDRILMLHYPILLVKFLTWI